MGRKYESFIARKAPQLDSIPNFSMSDFVAASGFTRAMAHEMFLTLHDHGYMEGNIG